MDMNHNALSILLVLFNVWEAEPKEYLAWLNLTPLHNLSNKEKQVLELVPELKSKVRFPLVAFFSLSILHASLRLQAHQ